MLYLDNGNYSLTWNEYKTIVQRNYSDYLSINLNLNILPGINIAANTAISSGFICYFFDMNGYSNSRNCIEPGCMNKVVNNISNGKPVILLERDIFMIICGIGKMNLRKNWCVH